MIASTSAGAGQKDGGGEGDEGKITGSTAARAGEGGGGGTTTPSEAGAGTALAAAGGAEDWITMSIMVGAATCSTRGCR